MSHLKWNVNTGYGISVAVESRIVRSSLVISNYSPIMGNGSEVERELCSKLVHELLTSKMIRVHQEKNIMGDIYFTAELTVVPQGIKMMNVSNDVYHINGEEFNEYDIIEALKHTYPERFI